MPSITLKNIPDSLYLRLKTEAKRNHRSMNGEVLNLLQTSLLHDREDPELSIARARALRERIDPGLVSDEDIQSAIDEGRP